MIEVVKKNSNAVEFADPILKCNQEKVMLAVKNNDYDIEKIE